MSGFREVEIAREEKKEEHRRQDKLQEEELRASKFVEAIKLALVSKEQKGRPGATPQLARLRFPPLWS